MAVEDFDISLPELVALIANRGVDGVRKLTAEYVSVKARALN